MLNKPLNMESENLNNIIKRLKLIQSLIELGEKDALELHTDKVISMDKQGLTTEITAALKEKKFGFATELIIKFTASRQVIIKYEDPEINALQLEIKYLENQLIEITNEKSEIEKIIARFNHQLHTKLGLLIEKLYELKTAFFKKKAEDPELDEQKKAEAKKQYEEHKQQYESYKEEQKTEKKKVFFELNEQEELDIKKLFKECAKMCHPDKFPNDPEKQKLATELFIELQLAYERNDLKTIKRLYEKLKLGILELDEKQQNNKELLKLRAAELRASIKKAEEELAAYKNTEVYNLVKETPDLDNYFKAQEQLLQEEIDSLKQKIGADGQ